MTETIGERLKALRKKHHFTQKQIADYLEFQQGQIAKLENNQRKLKVSSLEKLCELYNCDEEYILEGIEDNYDPKIAFRSNVKYLNFYLTLQMILMNLLLNKMIIIWNSPKKQVCVGNYGDWMNLHLLIFSELYWKKLKM